MITHSGRDSTNERFFAPCPRGLEPILADELRELGARNPTTTAGGVHFEGTWAICYRTNLESRVASRILWRVGSAPYRVEQDIYDAAHRLPWQSWFTPHRTIKVKVSAQHCPLKSLDFVTLRVKDAVCDRMRHSAGKRPHIDTKSPDMLIAAFLDSDHCTFYLDTSGDPLFKRGWRKSAAEAPLRENLAAGILRQAGWPKDITLFDPMCGAGTFAVEAALMARRIAPGIARRFAFEKFQHFNERTWRSLRESSIAHQLHVCPGTIVASDRDKQALDAAAANLEAAGVGPSVHLAQGNLLQQAAPADTGILLTNPPYGLRVGAEPELTALYPRIGDWLKQRFAGWTAYFFTADMRFPTLLRLSPSRRVPLFNGAIECRLYEFHLVSGSMRKTRPKVQDTSPI